MTSLAVDDVVTYEQVAQWLPLEIRAAIEAAMGWGSHGTVAGYLIHHHRRQFPCFSCCRAQRDYLRQARR